MIKFHTFNANHNPNDNRCYVPIKEGKPLSTKPLTKTFQEIVDIMKDDYEVSAGWMIPKNYALLETKADISKAIADNNEQVLSIKDDEKLYIVVKDTAENIRSTKNNTTTTCVIVDTKKFSKNNLNSRDKIMDNILILPFKIRGTSPADASKLTIVHYNGIEEPPYWLIPMYKISKDFPRNYIEPMVPITESKTALMRIIDNTKKIKGDIAFKTNLLVFANNHLLKRPLSPDELTKVIDTLQNIAENQEYFDSKGNFLHHLFGEYFIKLMNIKKCDKTGDLFFYEHNKNIYISNDDYILGLMTRMAPSLKDYQKTETLKYISQSLTLDMSSFNTNPLNIVFKNGILDLETMKFEQMSPEKLENIMLNVNYNTNAVSKTADEFFDTLTKPTIEQDKTIKLLYEAIGYSLLKTSELQIAFMLVGPGANGKSTYFDLIREILGEDNFTSVSLKDLGNNFRASNLINKLASLVGDISHQAIPDSELFKNLVVGESVLLEEKYKQAKHKAVFSTMFFSANKIPFSKDRSEGWYRRWCVIPMKANLKNISKVQGYMFKRHLLNDSSKEYVAYKAVKAIKNILENTMTFTEPQDVQIMLQQYKIDNSSVLSWYHEMYGDKKDITGSNMKKLFAEYQIWGETNSTPTVKASNFTYELMSTLPEHEIDDSENVVKKEEEENKKEKTK